MGSTQGFLTRRMNEVEDVKKSEAPVRLTEYYYSYGGVLDACDKSSASWMMKVKFEAMNDTAVLRGLTL